MVQAIPLYHAGEVLGARKMNQTVNSVNGLISRSSSGLLDTNAGRHDIFLAKVTGHTDVTANTKWTYTWEEVQISSKTSTKDTDIDELSPRTSNDPEGYALNLCEINNTAADAIGGDGVDSDGDDYPANFKRRPIGSQGTTDTHAVDVVVVMFMVYDDMGLKRPVFSQPNAHDGTC